MGGDGPQHTLDFGFGAFHDRAFHETTHRPHPWLPPTRQTVLFSPTHPHLGSGPSQRSVLLFFSRSQEDPATGTSFVSFPFFLRNREPYPRHLVGPPILVLGLGLGGVGEPRSWSVDDQTAAANQVPFRALAPTSRGFIGWISLIKLATTPRI